MGGVDQSYIENAQAVAIHSTSYVNVKGNVAFDIIGHMSGTQLGVAENS